MRRLAALTDLIASKSSPTAGDIVEVQGASSAGDGGGAQWKHNGITGQTASQSPAQLGDALLNDASGNQWALVFADAVHVDKLGAEKESSRSKAQSSTFDNIPVMVAAKQALQNASINGPIYFGDGYYRTESTFDVDQNGIWLEGVSSEETRIFGDHTAGPVVRFRDRRQGIKKIVIDASDDRQLAAYDSTNFGLLFEADDVPEPSSERMFRGFIDESSVEGQPGCGVVIVGPAFTGRITNSKISSNGWHGIVVDRGVLSGRTNLLTAGQSGVMNIENCRMKNNEGHSVALGNPTDNFTTQALRVVVDNCETGGTSTILSKLWAPTDIYFRCTNSTVKNSGIASNAGASDGGVFVAGRNNHLTNNRYLDCGDSPVIYGSYDILPSDGLYIKGVSVINPSASVDPFVLVRVESGETIEPKGLVFESENIQNIAEIAKTDSSMGSGNFRRIPGYNFINTEQIIVKQADQTLNSSTSFVSDSELGAWIQENETMIFEFNVYYSDDSGGTADVKLALNNPSGATLKYSAPDALKVNTSNSPVVASVETAANSPISLGGTATQRMATIAGIIENSSTAGYFNLRFAQVVSDANNITIHRGSVMKYKRVIF